MVGFSSIVTAAVGLFGELGFAAQLTKVNYPNNATSKAEM
jgi:hypothetical protein